MMFFTLLIIGGIISVNSAPHSPAHLSLAIEQIGEIMVICDENPSTCTCENGETLLSENFFPGIFACNPSTCVCPNGLTVNNLQSIEVEEVQTPETIGRMMALGNFMDYWSKLEKKFQTLCDGEAPESCNCANGDQLTDFIKNTDGLIVCKAQECQCSNGNQIQIPDNLRYSFFSRIENMCNVKDCSCFSNSSSFPSVIQPPFESISDIKDCAPTHCTCMDESREDLPKLPEMEDNLIESFDQIDKRLLQKMSTLCDGEEPQFCECYKREENMSVYGNMTEVRECYPTKCTCKNDSMKIAPNQRGAFIRILNYMDLTYGEEESKKMTSLYKYNCQGQRNSISHP